jgi:hypothetical protein
MIDLVARAGCFRSEGAEAPAPVRKAARDG